MRIIDNQYPERKIAAIYSKRDLEKLFNLQSMRSSLKNITIDKKIAGRYYQEAAVKALMIETVERHGICFSRNLIPLMAEMNCRRTQMP